MTNLNIAFHDGFDADTVVVTLDGHEVCRRSGVKTRRQIGLAFAFVVECEEGGHRLGIQVPNRQMTAEVNVDTGRTPYVGVSIETGRLVIKPSREDFFYA